MRVKVGIEKENEKMEIGEIVKGNVNMDERKVIVMKWREME